jgi:hypothetical protein
MKTYRPLDYAKRVHQKVQADVPNVSINTVKRIISLYIRNFNKVLLSKQIIVVNRWFKIFPYSKKSYLNRKT